MLTFALPIKNDSKVFRSAENILYVKSLEQTLENIHQLCDKRPLNLQIEKYFVFVKLMCYLLFDTDCILSWSVG